MMPPPSSPPPQPYNLLNSQQQSPRRCFDVDRTFAECSVHNKEGPHLESSVIANIENLGFETTSGRQIALNDVYICYGSSGGGDIVIRNRNNTMVSLLEGHSDRVTDMTFFAEKVHRLASTAPCGEVIVWDITEEEGSSSGVERIISKKVLNLRILLPENGEAKNDDGNPRICWHCNNKDILVVLSEFKVNEPTLTFTGSNRPEDPFVHLFCVHAEAIRRYTLPRCQILPRQVDLVVPRQVDPVAPASHPIRDAIHKDMEFMVVPVCERIWQAIFVQLDATIAKGIAEHMTSLRKDVLKSSGEEQFDDSYEETVKELIRIQKRFKNHIANGPEEDTAILVTMEKTVRSLCHDFLDLCLDSQ